MRTYVYVDGFNLYYGCLKGRRAVKWLDLDRLCRLLLPENSIAKINYYTARVSDRPHDPGKSTRQQIYLRALKTLPNVEIHLGHFLSHSVWMPMDVPSPAQQVHANDSVVYARVVRTEEKGSDVNIAAHLVRDAFRGEFEVAVIVSNDSDLLAPIRIVHREIGKIVGILNPQKRASRELGKEAAFQRSIRPTALKRSQFPDELTDSVGTFRKPPGW